VKTKTNDRNSINRSDDLATALAACLRASATLCNELSARLDGHRCQPGYCLRCELEAHADSQRRTLAAFADGVESATTSDISAAVGKVLAALGVQADADSPLLVKAR
jgi:hypothetical protein